MRGLHRSSADLPHPGFSPTPGCTPPRGTRDISTLAGLLAHESSSGLTFSPFGNGTIEAGLVATVAGAAAFGCYAVGDSRFSPCGPPVSDAVIAHRKELAR